MDLSIIIVNFNVKYFLEQCLYSIIKACENIEVEIFVVDNNSTDGSKEYLENRFSNVIFKWQSSNEGFAKANNIALKEAKGEYVLFLNPDTIVPEDCFENCIGFFRKNESCAALGVHMLDGSGKFLKESKRSFPSPLTSFFKMTGIAALFPYSKTFARYYAGHLPEGKDNEVDVLAGAFMMLRKSTIEKVKGFDEDFFMYGEDIDISYRIQQSGLKNFYFSGTTIIHFKGESTQKNSYNYIRTFYDAMQLFVSKHYKKNSKIFFAMNLAIKLSRFIATAKLFFKKFFYTNATVFKSHNTVVMSGQSAFDKIIHLIRYAKPPLTISGRIAIDGVDSGTFLGKINNAGDILKNSKADQLIFCEGELSFKKIIEFSDQLSGKANFLFHANNSNSIVGSSSKNEKGMFIAKQ